MRRQPVQTGDSVTGWGRVRDMDKHAPIIPDFQPGRWMILALEAGCTATLCVRQVGGWGLSAMPLRFYHHSAYIIPHSAFCIPLIFRLHNLRYNQGMHIILTHERADFDAVASLFGGWLLDETAFPILPRRLNRNVRAFLTLYGSEFPFHDLRDLPPGRVDAILLVDTQKMISVRGVNAQTRVRVLDHHPARNNLPADWDVRLETVGANTTLLVEAFREHNGHLTTAQATLLLLGIYEDTGSLTYASTTVRDVLAVAYLLEHGASLRLAADFLNHPLSAAQRALYEDLLAAAEVYEIHGARIVLACGDARGLDDEISTLAHKLRDALDPDGLFLLVLTDDGVRLAARSTTDRVDVGEIATLLGGGGHRRAAAALLPYEDDQSATEALAAACERVKTLLQARVRPALTVAQIMSRGPQVLTPDTPVGEAARLMQRYGYEGYPVVEDEHVIGLLTRRAVDRALAHGLNLTAARLMEAGSVFVYPDDSLQTLQEKMIDSGWGQIPVVSRSDERIIGIVTRTDLLKTLAPQTRRQRRNLAEALQQRLPPDRLWLLQQVAAAAESLRLPAYVVGGFVRDLLLARPSLDYDVVLEGEAERLAQVLVERFGGRVVAHRRFGTAKWFLPADLRQTRDLPPFLDLISARTEFYESPTALPIVRRGSIKLDLHRRDFTINTLAVRLDGRHYGDLHDYWGGLRDLEKGLVRVLHSLSFVDDPTRMLRAVRFEQRFGFAIETRTLELMTEACPLLDRLSGQRIRHELDLMLDEPQAAAMLARLHSLDLLTALDPPLPWDDFMARNLNAALDATPPPGFAEAAAPGKLPLRRALGYFLWLAPHPPRQVQAWAQRLRFPAAFARALQAIAHFWQARDNWPSRPSAFTAQADALPLWGLYALWLRLPPADPRRALLRRYAGRWRRQRPFTTGDDLRARGLPPGPRYRQILSRLRNAWLDGEIHTHAEEQALLARLLQER